MRFDSVRVYQDSLLSKGIAGNDCAVFIRGECVYRHFSGWADMEKKIAIGQDTIYQMYSMTKPVTCAAALKLVEQGKMCLSDSVAEYLPEFAEMTVRQPDGALRPAKNAIRLLDLFRMTAGICYDLQAEPLMQLAQTKPDYTTRDYASAIAQMPLAFEPGTRWLYGLCHDVLAAVTEVVSGKPFSMFLRETVFQPLDMREAFFHVPENLLTRMARKYVFEQNCPPQKKLSLDILFQQGKHESGGAGLHCTVDEYAKFAVALCAGDETLLQPETVALMRENQLPTFAARADFRTFKPHAHGYGLGVYTVDEEDEEGPFGWGGAAGTYVVMDPRFDLVIVTAYQAEPNPSDLVRPEMLTRIYRALGLGERPYYA